MKTITLGVPANVTDAGFTTAAPWVQEAVHILPPWILDLVLKMPPPPGSSLGHGLVYTGSCQVYGEAVLTSMLQESRAEGTGRQETPAKMEIRFCRIKPLIQTLLPELTRIISKSCGAPVGKSTTRKCNNCTRATSQEL